MELRSLRKLGVRPGETVADAAARLGISETDLRAAGKVLNPIVTAQPRPTSADDWKGVAGRSGDLASHDTASGGLWKHKLADSEPLSTKLAEMSADEILALAQSGQYLGAGSFVRAWCVGDSVIKQIKPVVGRPPEVFRLGPQDILRVAREIELATKRLRGEVGDVVMPVRNLGAGLLQMPFVSGLVQEELVLIDRLELADMRMQDLFNQASEILTRRTHGASVDGKRAVYPDGWSLWVDREAGNVRFDDDVEIAGWFDAIVIRPPDALRIA